MLIVELLNRLLWNSKNVCLKLIKYMIIKDNFLRLYKDHLIFFNYYFLIHSICVKMYEREEKEYKTQGNIVWNNS